MVTLPAVVNKIICLGIRVRVRFGVRARVSVCVRVSVTVYSFRDSFSVLLHPQHYSMLTTAATVNTSFLLCP